MAERIPQSAIIRIPLQAYLSSDHVTAATGKTIAVTISKNGGAYGNPSVGAANATEIGSGSYYVDLSTTDTGTLGPLFIKGTEAATDTIIAIYNVTSDKTGYTLTSAYDPAKTASQAGDAMTLTAAYDAAKVAASATMAAAIKTQTDKLTFTVANQLDANIQYVNDVQINGVGTSGSPWGP